VFSSFLLPLPSLLTPPSLLIQQGIPAAPISQEEQEEELEEEAYVQLPDWKGNSPPLPLLLLPPSSCILLTPPSSFSTKPSTGIQATPDQPRGARGRIGRGGLRPVA
jgi:hypothetical protein